MLQAFILACFIISNCADTSRDSGIVFSPNSLTVQKNRTKSFNVELRKSNETDEVIVLTFTYGDEKNASTIPTKYVYKIPDLSITNRTASSVVAGRAPGRVIIGAVSEQINISTHDIMVVEICKSTVLNTFCIIIGWVYFVVWSVSFYPQILLNFKRKSVVGLSFDFLALNVLGFFCLCVFDIGVFFVPYIKSIYFDKHPRSLNPVAVNDVIFALHAFLACVITVIQCFFYERGGQRITKFGYTALAVLGLFLVVSIIITLAKVIDALMLLYLFSYVKLATTLIKYIPQAVMNYKRKSTVGWSIGNILMDFTGGLASLLQQILSAHNYNDINFVWGNPVKFGLSLASMGFDILFIFQHYVLYRNAGAMLSDHDKTIK